MPTRTATSTPSSYEIDDAVLETNIETQRRLGDRELAQSRDHAAEAERDRHADLQRTFESGRLADRLSVLDFAQDP